MCAVGGCNSSHPEVDAGYLMSDVLADLQHRGDAATGISSMHADGRFGGYSAEGIATRVYTPDILKKLVGQTAIGHNLWPTDTNNPVMQPVWSEDTKFAFVHNGQLSETTEIREYLSSFHIDTEHFNDSQLAARAIEIALLTGKKKSLPNAVKKIYPMLNGGFACVAMHGHTMVAFRDRRGMRPLELAKIEEGYMVASETVAFREGVAEYQREVEGGEMVVMENGEKESYRLAKFKPKYDPLEPIYIAERNSLIFGKSADHIRRRMGAQLAKQFPFTDKEYVVTPVPTTSIPIAETYAHKLGLEYKSAITVGRYKPTRTFMQRSAESQQKAVKSKFHIVPGSVTDRDVIVIDDSGVRFTTAPEIVTKLKNDGARSVTVLFASPPVGYPDHSGIDTRKQEHLPAASKTVEEIRQLVGCERLGYLALKRFLHALEQPANKMNLSIYDGKYPYDIGDHEKEIVEAISKAYLEDAYAEV